MRPTLALAALLIVPAAASACDGLFARAADRPRLARPMLRLAGIERTRIVGRTRGFANPPPPAVLLVPVPRPMPPAQAPPAKK